MRWEMLAAWLNAQWVDTDLETFPLHKGLFEGRAECAEVIAKCPAEWTAEQKLTRLFEVLHGSLMRTDSPEESDDD